VKGVTLRRANEIKEDAMKTRRKIPSFKHVWLWLGAFILPICAVASQGDFYPSYEAKIVGHVVLSGKPTRQMFLQQEGRRAYLYVRQASQQGYTVFDVTKPERPKLLNQLSQRNLTILDSGLAISETPNTASPSPSVGGAGRSQGGSRTPESVRVLDVSNPAHPKTVQTFEGVTSIVRDDARSLIYVANGDGIWILSHREVLRRHLCSSSDAISSAIPNCD
jgi:hypothetical protein